LFTYITNSSFLYNCSTSQWLQGPHS